MISRSSLLIEQLNLAAELGLPVVIHNRQASGDLLPILAQWRKELLASGSPLAEKAGVLHSFSDSLEIAQAALEMGFYLGIGGPVTFQNAKNLQEVVRDLPLTRLIIETDGPFLAPHPHRGKRNEPAYVALVAEKIAAIKSMSLSGVCETTTENAGSLFNW
jgi:TatD DNase family protein